MPHPHLQPLEGIYIVTSHKENMPAFDPMNYVPSDGEETADGGMRAGSGAVDDGIPYGTAGVVSMAVGFFIFAYGPPNVGLIGMFGLLLVLVAPFICSAGKNRGESASWTKFTFTVVIFPALLVLVSFPLLMLGYGSR